MQTSYIDSINLSLRWDATYYDPDAAKARKRIQSGTCEVRRLRDCVENVFSGPFGSNLLENEYVDDGLPIVRPLNLTGTFSPSSLVTIPKKVAEEKCLKMVTNTTLLFARVGDPAVGTLPAHMHEATISPNIIAAEVGSKSDVDYLYAFFSTSVARTLMNAAVKKVAQPTIGVEELADICVPMPDDSVQKAIGNKVKAYRLLMQRAEKLWEDAVLDVESVIDGTLCKETCLVESKDLSAEFRLEVEETDV